MTDTPTPLDSDALVALYAALPLDEQLHLSDLASRLTERVKRRQEVTAL